MLLGERISDTDILDLTVRKPITKVIVIRHELIFSLVKKQRVEHVSETDKTDLFYYVPPILLVTLCPP